jgi:hypothetical protein
VGHFVEGDGRYHHNGYVRMLLLEELEHIFIVAAAHATYH